MYALAGLTKANLQNDAAWRVKYQLAAAIVFQYKNQYSVAKNFAEEVLNSEPASRAVRARAAIVLASAALHLDKLVTARGVLRAIEDDLGSLDPSVIAHLTFMKGQVELVRGATATAEPLYRGALELYWQQNNFAEIARCSMKLSEVCLELDRPAEAQELAKQSLKFAKQATDTQVAGWAHLVLGRLHLARRERGDAKEHLLTAEQNGKWRADDELVLLARVFLMQWSHLFEDKILLRIMRDHVRAGLKKLHLLRNRRMLAAAILGEISQEGS
jgi:tetratricopeptide (TPR) repeat protein